MLNNPLLTVVLLGAMVGIPLLARQSSPQEGQPGEPLAVYDGGYSFEPAQLTFQRTEVGPDFKHRPQITNVKIVDFDGDGHNDVLVSDAQRHEVILYRQTEDGSFEERVLGSDLLCPIATPVDFNQNGRMDVLVAILGDLNFDNDAIGQVILLEQEEDGSFTRRLIDTDRRRIADLEAADLNDNGRMDIVVAEFGYDLGSVYWLENLGDYQFRDHELVWAPGTVHVPVADFNGDGLLDIAAIVSQDEEEIWIFENLGDGQFNRRLIHYDTNMDLGAAGLVAADVNSNGMMDLIWPVGDNFEDPHSYPQPYHGCFWLENLGDFNFKVHRIAEFGGTYAAAVGDLDGDGHQDVVLVSMTNVWSDTRNASVVWLRNDGEQNFTPLQIASDPIQMPTVAVGDLNGDGLDDVVAGGLHFFPPFNRLGRVTAWISETEDQP